MFKNNYIKKISENFNVQFRAEIFNILNHANFARPSTPTNTDIFDGTGNTERRELHCGSDHQNHHHLARDSVRSQSSLLVSAERVMSG